MSEQVWGDIGGQPGVDITDAIAIGKYLAGTMELTPDQQALLDVDLSGKVDINDAKYIGFYLAGTLEELAKRPTATQATKTAWARIGKPTAKQVVPVVPSEPPTFKPLPAGISVDFDFQFDGRKLQLFNKSSWETSLVSWETIPELDLSGIQGSSPIYDVPENVDEVTVTLTVSMTANDILYSGRKVKTIKMLPDVAPKVAAGIGAGSLILIGLVLLLLSSEK